MTWALIVDRHEGLICAALVDGRVVIDLYAEREERPGLTGALVRAKAVQVLPKQNAAIMRWGDKTEEGYWPDAKTVKAGDWATLQVKSDAWRNKLPQLTADVALPGYFLIYRPFGKGRTFSKRAKDKSIAWRGAGFPGGWILRRQAASATLEQLEREAVALARWGESFKNMPDQPAILMRRPAWQNAVIDYAAELKAVYCSESGMAESIRVWLQEWFPHLSSSVRVEQHNLDFEALLQGILMPTLAFPPNGSLTIEATRGFYACDVDAGNMGRLEANIAAARLLARQMRLRNMGGMIIADFLTMKSVRDKQAFMKALHLAVAEDPAGVEIFGLTKLGLVEMTRTRRGPGIEDLLSTSV